MKKRKERGAFIDTVQAWFRQRSGFWVLISFVTLAGIVGLQFLLVLQTETSPNIRQGIDSILIPLLVLFVLSMSWRGSVPMFLSLAGAVSVYAGVFYVYAKAVGFETLPPALTNKALPEVKILETVSVTSAANFYFMVGMFALILSIVIALKPSFFHARGSRFKQHYQVWTIDDYLKSSPPNAHQLVPVSGLLSFVENHLVTKYKYILVFIGDKTYYVRPDEWVPEGSSVVRDKESGSLLGIPKVPDGFNVW